MTIYFGLEKRGDPTVVKVNSVSLKNLKNINSEFEVEKEI